MFFLESGDLHQTQKDTEGHRGRGPQRDRERRKGSLTLNGLRSEQDFSLFFYRRFIEDLQSPETQGQRRPSESPGCQLFKQSTASRSYPLPLNLDSGRQSVLSSAPFCSSFRLSVRLSITLTLSSVCPFIRSSFRMKPRLKTELLI